MHPDPHLDHVVQKAIADAVQRAVDDAVERAAKAAAAEAAEIALRRAFRNLGMDLEDPSHVVDWHADRLWTRQAREGSGSLKRGLQTSILGSVLTAILFGLWTLINNHYSN